MGPCHKGYCQRGSCYRCLICRGCLQRRSPCYRDSCYRGSGYRSSCYRSSCYRCSCYRSSCSERGTSGRDEKVFPPEPIRENCWKAAKFWTMRRFSCAVMGWQPRCCSKYKTRLRYSLSPACSVSWCEAKSSSYRNSASHSWHTKGPHNNGVLENSRRASPLMAMPGTCCGSPRATAAAAFTRSLNCRTKDVCCKLGSFMYRL